MVVLRISSADILSACAVMRKLLSAHADALTSVTLRPVCADWMVVAVLDGPNVEQAKDAVLCWATVGLTRQGGDR